MPSIYDLNTFSKKTSEELENQIFKIQSKNDNDYCLIPEVTGILQEKFNKNWFFEYKKKPLKLFYVNRCYRYETPQKGRYREFTQFGVEILGGNQPELYKTEIDNLVTDILNLFPDLKYNINPNVKRGLGYYTEDGFEVECQKLGTQKQIIGGGRYKEGIGFAIGIDRLILALNS